MSYLMLPLRYCLLALCCASLLLSLHPAAASAQEPAGAQVQSLLDVHKALVYIEAVGTFLTLAEENEEVQVSQGQASLSRPMD